MLCRQVQYTVTFGGGSRGGTQRSSLAEQGCAHEKQVLGLEELPGVLLCVVFVAAQKSHMETHLWAVLPSRAENARPRSAEMHELMVFFIERTTVKHLESFPPSSMYETSCICGSSSPVNL